MVFVCQNNLYGEHTAFENGTACDDIATRATSYNMPGVKVNGNDPDAMYRASREAIERARKGDGPTLIEAVTFRFEGHVLGDTGHYIPKEQMEEALRNDPVPILRRRLISEGMATEEQIAAMEAQIDAEIAAAREFALSEPYPDVAELGRDVLVEEIRP